MVTGRSLASVVFLSIYLLAVGIVSGCCAGITIYVLYQLVASTSPGNGAKYRFWLQIGIKNGLICVFGDLVHLIVVISTGSGGEVGTFLLSESAVCYVTGYMHVLLLLAGCSFLCALHFYQYLSVVLTPLEHPKYLYSWVLWALMWGVPMLVTLVMPATRATDIRFSYNRLTCTFIRKGNVDHDTALLILVSTTLGFTCVFCAILTLKVNSAMKDELKLVKEGRHISLFGDKLVQKRRTTTDALTTDRCTDGHRADFKLLCLLTLGNIVLLLPYVVLIFAAAANSGSVGREWEEFALLVLRLVPVLDFLVLLQDLIFKSRTLETLRALDYTFKCFYCRNFCFKRRVIQVTPKPAGQANQDDTTILPSAPELE